MGKTSVKAVNKYIQKAYDRINFVMPKGRKEEIKDRAIKEGVSASEWINGAIADKLNAAYCASGEYDFCANIPDLAVYAKSIGLTPEEYVKIAVAEKMERQDQEYQEEITREKLDY